MDTKKTATPSFFKRAIAFILHPRMNRIQLNLLVSVLLVLFYNHSFWAEIGEISAHSMQDRLFLGSIFLLLVAFFNLCLSLFSFRPVLKPCLIVTLLIATLAAYFMKTYGIMIDRSMVKNILTTDMGDISELLNVKMLYFSRGVGRDPVGFCPAHGDPFQGPGAGVVHGVGECADKPGGHGCYSGLFV